LGKLWLVPMIVVVSVAMAAPEAPARAPARGATASAGFVTIGGPKKLQARKKLRAPIRCPMICDVKATWTLVVPGPNVGPQTITGRLDPAAPRDLVIKLTGPGVSFLKTHIGSSKLKVKVRAMDPTTGAVAFDRKTFGFKRA
jgi:hypothetical protein